MVWDWSERHAAVQEQKRAPVDTWIVNTILFSSHIGGKKKEFLFLFSTIAYFSSRDVLGEQIVCVRTCVWDWQRCLLGVTECANPSVRPASPHVPRFSHFILSSVFIFLFIPLSKYVLLVLTLFLLSSKCYIAVSHLSLILLTHFLSVLLHFSITATVGGPSKAALDGEDVDAQWLLMPHN